MGAFFNNGEQYGGTATTASQVMYNTTESVADKIDELGAKTGEDIPVNTLTPNTSINSAINACFGRTGSDIPVSTGETETIAEAIDSLVSPIQQTITAGSNITSFETRVFKTGKIVNGYVVFKPTAAVADTNTIFATGLPVPADDRLIILLAVCVAGTNSGKVSRVAVNANGQLISWYHSSGFFATTDTYFIATNYAAK